MAETAQTQPGKPADKSAWPASNVEHWPIDKLIPYARNARIHSADQIEKIAAAMVEWGWTNPVLIDDEGTIIAGHGRILAAQLLGITEAPVMIAKGWTDAQKRAYGIADNQLGLNSSWNRDLLAVEIQSIDGLKGLLGFDAKDIGKMLGAVKAPDEFKAFGDDIETEFCCPRCNYRWSGKPDPERQ